MMAALEMSRVLGAKLRSCEGGTKLDAKPCAETKLVTSRSTAYDSPERYAELDLGSRAGGTSRAWTQQTEHPQCEVSCEREEVLRNAWLGDRDEAERHGEEEGWCSVKRLFSGEKVAYRAEERSDTSNRSHSVISAKRSEETI